MWYFSWILGVGLASAFGILNAMWFEMKQDNARAAASLRPARRPDDGDRS